MIRCDHHPSIIIGIVRPRRESLGQIMLLSKPPSAEKRLSSQPQPNDLQSWRKFKFKKWLDALAHPMRITELMVPETADRRRGQSSSVDKYYNPLLLLTPYLPYRKICIFDSLNNLAISYIWEQKIPLPTFVFVFSIFRSDDR